MNENYVTLGQVCAKGSSNIAQKDLAEREGQYPIYGAAGLIKNVDFAHQKQPYIAVVKDGAGIGRVMKLPAYSSVIGTMQYIFPKENVDIDYLFYALQHMNLGKYFSGSTIPHIYFRDYQKERLKLPVMEVQQRQADTLSRIDALSAYGQRQIALMDDIVKSRFVEMFGEPITNTHSLPLISLSEVGSWNSGGTPSRANPAYFEGDIDWYSAGELNTLYLEGSVEKITQDALENSTAKLFPAGSMLVGMYDTAAFKMGILKWSSASNQACACIEPNNSIDIVWLYHVLQIMKPHFLEQRRGIRQKNLNLGMIKSFQIPYASKSEQNRFAAFVAEVDKSKLAVKQSLEKLENLKKSLMQQYFG